MKQKINVEIHSDTDWTVSIDGKPSSLDNLFEATYNLVWGLYYGNTSKIRKAIIDGADTSVTINGQSLSDYNEYDTRECRRDHIAEIAKILSMLR